MNKKMKIFNKSKGFRARTAAALLLLPCLLFSACTARYSGEKTPLEGGQPDAEVVSDGGRAAQQGDWIYFINGDNFTRETERFAAFSGALCRMRTDGTDPGILVDLDVSLFNIDGGYIYFVTYESNKSYACRVGINGMDFRRFLEIDNIYDGGCYDFGGGYIYYTKDYKLFRMDLEGNNRTQLTDYPIYNLRAGSQYAFFTQDINDDIGPAYKIAHNSTDPVKVTSAAAYVLDIQDDMAYYYMLDNGYAYQYDQYTGKAESIAHKAYEEYLFMPQQGILCASYTEEETGMYILPLGSEEQVRQISEEDSAARMAYYDGYIYYINKSSLSELYRIRPDGTGREVISEDYILDTDSLDIFDGWIYYFSDGDEGRIYRLSIDTLKAQCIQIEDIGIVE